MRCLSPPRRGNDSVGSVHRGEAGREVCQAVSDETVLKIEVPDRVVQSTFLENRLLSKLNGCINNADEIKDWNPVDYADFIAAIRTARNVLCRRIVQRSDPTL